VRVVGSCLEAAGGYSRSSSTNSSALSRVARRVAAKTISSRAGLRGSSTARPAFTSITAVGDSAVQTKPARRSARRQSAHKTSPRRSTEARSARTVPFDLRGVCGGFVANRTPGGHPAKAKCKRAWGHLPSGCSRRSQRALAIAPGVDLHRARRAPRQEAIGTLTRPLSIRHYDDSLMIFAPADDHDGPHVLRWKHAQNERDSSS
jgi:hypothetical protein